MNPSDDNPIQTLLYWKERAEKAEAAQKAALATINETKHTQGTCGLFHPKKLGVAVAWFSSTHTPKSGFVGEAEPVVGYPEREANAHLIAAAPDLLAALECWDALFKADKVIFVKGPESGFEETWGRTIDAIRKAKGQPRCVIFLSENAVKPDFRTLCETTQ